MNKKITTIDELAVMMGKSFEAMEARITGQIAELVAHMDKIDSRAAVVSLEIRVGKIEREMKFEA